jgi:RNA polymerase sigma-70 factor (ECF subfamily)
VDHPAATSQTWYDWLEANAARYLLFARSQARCEADAQDLLQEVLVEVWRRESVRPPDDALVFKTLRRRAIDLVRRADRRERREQATPDWWQPPDDQPARDAELESAVKALPAHLREVVLLKVWGSLTFRQIAAALDLPPATAASRYRYAIGHLRNALKEVGP